MLLLSMSIAVSSAWVSPSRTTATPSILLQAHRPDVKEETSRRDLLRAALTVATAATCVSSSSPASAVDDNDNNEFVARLRAQSEANKDAYRKQSIRTDKLSPDAFNAQYTRPKYVGVRRELHDPGSVTMVTRDELDALVQAGRVEQKYTVTIDERTGEARPDYAQGKLYVFVAGRAEEVVVVAAEEVREVVAADEQIKEVIPPSEEPAVTSEDKDKVVVAS